jgi:hypothetical protein
MVASRALLPVRRGLVVPFEEVLAVVVAGVAEHAVDVVGVAFFAAGAGVVVLDQDGRAVDAEVTGAGGVGGAHPGEVDLADAFAFDFGAVGAGDGFGLVVHVLVDEGPEHFLLSGGHGRRGEAFDLLQGLVALGAGEEAGWEFVAEDGGGALLLGERVDESVAFRPFGGEDAPAGLVAFFDLVGLGAPEGGSAGHDTVDDGEVEGEMVAVELPAPAFVGGGVAEDVDVVAAGTEGGAGAAVVDEDLFAVDDGGGLQVALGAEGGAHEFVGEGAAAVGHFGEGDSFARDVAGGKVAPVFALGVIEGEHRAFAVFGGKGVKEALNEGSGAAVVGRFGGHSKQEHERTEAEEAAHGGRYRTT